MGRYYIGTDIGGTHVRSAVYDCEDGCVQIMGRRLFVKTGSICSEMKNNIYEMIASVISKQSGNKKELVGIGVSLPANFDRNNGWFLNWPNNNSWNHFPFKERLSEEFGVPVEMEDDANAACLGEYLAGTADRSRDFAYLTISTGIGCGLFLNGRIFYGANGWAGEIGHVQMTDNGPECVCGRSGCLQALPSGPGILNRARFLYDEYVGDGRKPERLEEVARQAGEGHPWAVEAFNSSGYYLAWALCNLITLTDIDTIILGGGVLNTGCLLMDPLLPGMKKRNSMISDWIRIRQSKLGDAAGLMGALNVIHYSLHRQYLPGLKEVTVE